MNCETNNQLGDDAELYFSVGRRFLIGQGVKKDIKRAKELLTQAAAMGHPLAVQLLTTLAESTSPKKGKGKKLNITILAGSPRKGGNTDLLVEAFVQGIGTNHKVETIRVSDLNIHPCIGCNACFANKGNQCCQKDDMTGLYKKLAKSDLLVIASPVYFYGLSAQIKTVIDRLHNPIRDSFKISQMALIVVGAATLPELFDAILTEYKLCLNFFKLEDRGTLLVRGVKEKGEVSLTDYINQAKQLGASI